MLILTQGVALGYGLVAPFGAYMPMSMPFRGVYAYVHALSIIFALAKKNEKNFFNS